MRWGVSVIITDVTKTWLDLRAALQSMSTNLTRSWRHSTFVFTLTTLFFSTDDYEKIGSQYGRLFLWTPQFFSPILMWQRRVDQFALERVAGPFDDFLASNSIVEWNV